MNKILNIFIGFICVFVIAIYAIGYASTVQAPLNTTVAGQQYENLSKTVAIADAGVNGLMLLIIITMVICAIVFMVNTVKRS